VIPHRVLAGEHGASDKETTLTAQSIHSMRTQTFRTAAKMSLFVSRDCLEARNARLFRMC
jgi:hypothetical protein